MEPKNETGFISLADEEAVKQLLISTLLDLWKVVNKLTRLRPSKQERFRVTIFGSSRAKPDDYSYKQVKLLAKALSEMDCDVISGGGPGLMQAANEGAFEAGAQRNIRSIGIRIHLPFEQGANPFVTDLFEHETFFTRLHHFVLASDAFVIAPGGIGTTLEAFMIWQLLQVKHITNAPLIFTGKMWHGLLEWTQKEFLRKDVSLVNPEDLQIPQCVDNAEQAIELLKIHHDKWLAERSKQ